MRVPAGGHASCRPVLSELDGEDCRCVSRAWRESWVNCAGVPGGGVDDAAGGLALRHPPAQVLLVDRLHSARSVDQLAHAHPDRVEVCHTLPYRRVDARPQLLVHDVVDGLVDAVLPPAQVVLRVAPRLFSHGLELVAGPAGALGRADVDRLRVVVRARARRGQQDALLPRSQFLGLVVVDHVEGVSQLGRLGACREAQHVAAPERHALLARRVVAVDEQAVGVLVLCLGIPWLAPEYRAKPLEHERGGRVVVGAVEDVEAELRSLEGRPADSVRRLAGLSDDGGSVSAMDELPARVARAPVAQHLVAPGRRRHVPALHHGGAGVRIRHRVGHGHAQLGPQPVAPTSPAWA